VPADHGVGLHDQRRAKQLLLPHPQAGQQKRQPLASHEPRPFPKLTLEDEHLLSKSEDLTVSMVRHQATDDRGDGRENQQDYVPEHTPRIVAQRSGVKGENAWSSGAQRQRRSITGPHGVSSDNGLNWLPGSERIRTSCPTVDVPLFVAPAPSSNGRPTTPCYRHAFVAEDLIPPRGPVPLPEETPLQRARRFQRMIDTGQAENRADLARPLGCSRAWVTKVLARAGCME
jgi:hypothetical protein